MHPFRAPHSAHYSIRYEDTRSTGLASALLFGFAGLPLGYGLAHTRHALGADPIDSALSLLVIPLAVCMALGLAIFAERATSHRTTVTPRDVEVERGVRSVTIPLESIDACLLVSGLEWHGFGRRQGLELVFRHCGRIATLRVWPRNARAVFRSIAFERSRRVHPFRSA